MPLDLDAVVGVIDASLRHVRVTRKSRVVLSELNTDESFDGLSGHRDSLA
jgi:hypothetical protein